MKCHVYCTLQITVQVIFSLVDLQYLLVPTTLCMYLTTVHVQYLKCVIFSLEMQMYTFSAWLFAIGPFSRLVHTTSSSKAKTRPIEAHWGEGVLSRGHFPGPLQELCTSRGTVLMNHSHVLGTAVHAAVLKTFAIFQICMYTIPPHYHTTCTVYMYMYIQ